MAAWSTGLDRFSVEMRGERGSVVGVHDGQHLFDHPEGGADSKHAHSDADHHQQAAQFVAPKVVPDFIPDYAHIFFKLTVGLRTENVRHDGFVGAQDRPDLPGTYK